LTQKLTEYLPPADEGNLEYYRIVIKAWPEYDKCRAVEINLKLQKKNDFPLALKTNVGPSNNTLRPNYQGWAGNGW
jgi:hypothetical protein